MREKPFSRSDKHKQEKTHMEHKVYTRKDRVRLILLERKQRGTRDTRRTRRSSGNWTAPGSGEAAAAAVASDAVV